MQGSLEIEWLVRQIEGDVNRRAAAGWEVARELRSLAREEGARKLRRVSRAGRIVRGFGAFLVRAGERLQMAQG